VNVVDTNVLVYAVDPLSAFHSRAKRWLDGEISSGRRVLIPWLALVGFVRLTTLASLAMNPMTTDEAIDIVEAWLGNANVICPQPDGRHMSRVREILAATAPAGGNLVNDAHIAALALQYKANIVSFDNDFARFPEVRWVQPA